MHFLSFKVTGRRIIFLGYGMIRIELTWLELFSACMVGVVRRISSLRNPDIVNRRFSDKGDWQIDIEGAIGEACFAKYQNLYWSMGVNTFKDPDVGTWQVRGTSYHKGHLIVRERDGHDAIALVATSGMGGTLIGWIKIEDAKKPEFWNEDSWWVPQKILIPFADDTVEQTATEPA